MKSKDQILLEEAYKTVTEANTSWGDEAVESSSEDVIDMAEKYIDNHYISDQGYGEDEYSARQEQPVLARKLLKLKGKKWLEKLDDLASASTYNAEYGSVSSEELNSMRKELGLPL